MKWLGMDGAGERERERKRKKENGRRDIRIDNLTDRVLLKRDDENEEVKERIRAGKWMNPCMKEIIFVCFCFL